MAKRCTIGTFVGTNVQSLLLECLVADNFGNGLFLADKLSILRQFASIVSATVLRLNQRTSLAEAERSQAERDVGELRDKYTTLRRQFDELQAEMLTKMSTEDHANAIANLKKSVLDW